MSFTPNLSKLFATEAPFWLRTLTRMDALGTLDVSASSYRRRYRGYAGTPAAIEEEERLAGERERAARAAGASSSGQAVAAAAAAAGAARYGGEVPNQPYKDLAIQAALDSTGDLGRYTPASLAGAAGADQQSYGPRDPLSYNPYSGRADGEQLAGDAMSRVSEWVACVLPPVLAWLRCVSSMRNRKGPQGCTLLVPGNRCRCRCWY